jgi:hypothetical protein
MNKQMNKLSKWNKEGRVIWKLERGGLDKGVIYGIDLSNGCWWSIDSRSNNEAKIFRKSSVYRCIRKEASVWEAMQYVENYVHFKPNQTQN